MRRGGNSGGEGAKEFGQLELFANDQVMRCGEVRSYASTSESIVYCNDREYAVCGKLVLLFRMYNVCLIVSAKRKDEVEKKRKFQETRSLDGSFGLDKNTLGSCYLIIDGGPVTN